ncbi:putative Target of EGR1 protein 1 [Daphnia magna]|uniref:Target of EGR1 protein 1 n=1 Tax=Daphnia magna TaxID=35525 RepID=A0A164UPR8_9CRUS|nr:putative Target of EGR1 protein 1 [Daphnia magna]
MEESFMVSVFDAHKDNLQFVWPSIVCSIQNASFIAVDCELSGLGSRKLINSQAVDDRYKNISEVAKTRSIISLGLSCFKLSECEKTLNFSVQTFNFMALCAEDFLVEPSALQFLVTHGFDFNKQYSQGVPYNRGNDTSVKGKSKKNTWDLRDLFTVMVSAKVPLVLHNGLVDLVFLYQNLYADLPTKLSSFLADLEMMFPSGIYDTKFVAEFSLRTSASFLEYIFRSHQVKNINLKNSCRPHVICNHTLIESDFVDFWDCSPRLQHEEDMEICTNYINHGFCNSASNCKKSHDVYRAVLLEEQKKTKKRKRKDESQVVSFEASHVMSIIESPRQERFRGHRAGHDAFMTGFCFASFIAQRSSTSLENVHAVCWKNLVDRIVDVRNRVCLSGKDFPLVIQKSAFSKCSKSHLEKYERLFPGL